MKCNSLKNYQELQEQKPKNIENISILSLKELYPKKVRRIYAKSKEILSYWEKDFYLDWGEPQCFACGVYVNKWEHCERCHIISARHGGCGEAWNIVYLCEHCHSFFDATFSGKPNTYYSSIKWLKEHRDFLIKEIHEKVKTFIKQNNYKELIKKIDIIVFARYMRKSKRVQNPDYNKYLNNHIQQTLHEKILAEMKFTYDYFNKKRGNDE